MKSSKYSVFIKSSRPAMNCCRSYICVKKNCQNIPDIGVNRRSIIIENDVRVCCTCNHVAEPLKCETCLIIEKELERMKNMVRNFAIHTSNHLV